MPRERELEMAEFKGRVLAQMEDLNRQMDELRETVNENHEELKNIMQRHFDEEGALMVGHEKRIVSLEGSRQQALGFIALGGAVAGLAATILIKLFFG